MSSKPFDKNFGSNTFASENKVDELKEVLKGRADISEQEPLLEENKQGSDLEALQKKITDAEEALKQTKEASLRALADFENARKRLEKEKQDSVRYANEKLLHEFFPVLDSLELTLNHATDQNDPLMEGVKLVFKQFLQVLERCGVEIISGEGESFDPHRHEAIGSQESCDQKPGTILSVHRKGFALGGRLVRPALVTIAKAEETQEEETIH